MHMLAKTNHAPSVLGVSLKLFCGTTKMHFKQKRPFSFQNDALGERFVRFRTVFERISGPVAPWALCGRPRPHPRGPLQPCRQPLWLLPWWRCNILICLLACWLVGFCCRVFVLLVLSVGVFAGFCFIEFFC